MHKIKRHVQIQFRRLLQDVISLLWSNHIEKRYILGPTEREITNELNYKRIRKGNKFGK